MNGLLFLTSEDFTVQQSGKGNVMCHGIPGFSLILFYSTSCRHCQGLLPIFKSLPGTIGGCQFGVINVSMNRQCVEMSKGTFAPITYVPYIVLFIDGKPFMAYKGEYDANQIRQFVIDVANHVQKNQQFAQNRVKQDEAGQIPGYTIGKPVIGTGKDSVCYLTFLTAYPNGANGPMGKR